MKNSNKRYQLVIRKSINHMYASILDTTNNSVLYTNSTLSLKLKSNIKSCEKLGAECGSKIKDLKIVSDISFNRSKYKFHGKVKSLADAARQSGAEF